MASKSIPEDIHYVDPIFAIPDGLSNYQHIEGVSVFVDGEQEAGSQPQGDGTDDGPAPDFGVDVGSGVDPDYSGALETPDEIRVIDQRLRTTATGNQVVDILVEVDDMPGGVEYEFKVAKAE